MSCFDCGTRPSQTWAVYLLNDSVDGIEILDAVPRKAVDCQVNSLCAANGTFSRLDKRPKNCLATTAFLGTIQDLDSVTDH